MSVTVLFPGNAFISSSFSIIEAPFDTDPRHTEGLVHRLTASGICVDRSSEKRGFITRIKGKHYHPVVHGNTSSSNMSFLESLTLFVQLNPDVDFTIWKITDMSHVYGFIYQICQEGILFHPDVSFSEFTNVKTGQPSFTKEESKRRDELMLSCFDVCEKNGLDIYQVSMDIEMKHPFFSGNNMD